MRRSLLVCCAVLIVGCSGGESTEGGGGQAGDGGAGGEGGSPVVFAPETTSCEDAFLAPARTNSLGGTFYEMFTTAESAGDIDYMRFPAERHQWITLAWDSEPTEVLWTFDNPIAQVSLESESGGPFLRSVGHFATFAPAVAGDRVVTRTPSGGELCLAFEDRGVGPEFADKRLLAVPLAEAYENFALEREPNDEEASAQAIPLFALSTTIEVSNILGVLDGADDIDVFELETPDPSTIMLLPQPAFTTDELGSTLRRYRIDVYEGDALVSRLQVHPGVAGAIELVPHAPTVRVEVHRASEALPADNDFYHLLVMRGPYARNNSSASTPESAGSPPWLTGQGTGTELRGDDAHWWAFDADAGQHIEVTCLARHAGGSLRDATLTLFEGLCDTGTACQEYDPEPVASQQETETTAIVWSDRPFVAASRPAIVAPSSATYFLRLQGSVHDESVGKSHYLCGSAVVDPSD